MAKRLYNLFLALIGIIFMLSAGVSAYSYMNQNSNQNMMFRSTEQNSVFPSYSYSPDTYANSYNYNNIGSSYNLKYQGPLSERTTSYEMLYTRSKKGAILYAIRATTNEKYSGETLALTKSSQDKSNSGAQASSTSNNPTTFNGGSFWRYEPYYDYGSSSANSNSNNKWGW